MNERFFLATDKAAAAAVPARALVDAASIVATLSGRLGLRLSRP